MSGGVDSSVCAYLLKEAGHETAGMFLHLGSAEGTGSPCGDPLGARDAARVAESLGIPLHIVEASQVLERIIDDFVGEYRRGRTPNPCVRCNEWLKFGSAVREAKALGARFIATGHHARLGSWPGGFPRLLRGVDPEKDQSYFLVGVSPEVLRTTLMPIGEHTKDDVRRIARNAGLPVHGRPESQEICFVPGQDYRSFVRSRPGGRSTPGEIVDRDGRVLGTHPGHENFTIGQRRGLGVALGSPRYVIAIEAERNRIVIGRREDTLRDSAELDDVRWLTPSPPPQGEPMDAEVEVRYRQSPCGAVILRTGPATARIRFHRPQNAIAPGQAAVLYRGDVVLGGGWIR